MTPQELAATPTGSLCVAYARAILNGNRDAWLDEVYRRGQTCAPYANEMAIVAAQSQASLNAINARYAPPAAMRAPGPMAATGFFQGSTVAGPSRFCRYDVVGRVHIVTISAAQLCAATIQAPM